MGQCPGHPGRGRGDGPAIGDARQQLGNGATRLWLVSRHSSRGSRGSSSGRSLGSRLVAGGESGHDAGSGGRGVEAAGEQGGEGGEDGGGGRVEEVGGTHEVDQDRHCHHRTLDLVQSGERGNYGGRG